MKQIKKITSFLLIVCFISTSFFPVNAQSKNNSIAVDHYMTEIVRNFIIVNNCCEDSIYYLSQSFNPRQNSEKTDTLIYLVFSSNQCIGEIIVTLSENEINTTFLSVACDLLSTLYKERKSLAIVSDNDSIFAVTDETVEYLWGRNKQPSSRCLNTSKSVIILYEIDFSDYSPSRLGDWGQLYVELVDNDIDPDGEGMCWAAVCSSIGAYKNNDSSPDSALTLYHALDDIGYVIGGHPKGNPLWILRAFLYYGYDTVYQNETGLSYSTVKSVILQNKPIYAGLRTQNETARHAVEICGYSSVQGGYYYYTFMDPNVSSGYVTVSVPSTGTNFTYNDGSDIYISWGRHAY